MTTNNSHKKAQKVVFITLCIVVILPVSIYITYLLLNKPTTRINNSATRTEAKPATKLTGVIDEELRFEYTKPDDSWNHKVIKSEKNKIDKLTSYQIEISNGKSKINLNLVENDLRYKQYSTFDPNYVPNSLNSQFYGLVDYDNTKSDIILNNSSQSIVRIKNIRLGSGEIFVDTRTIKDKKVQSTITPFNNYSTLFKNQELLTQITYDNDTPDNYRIMDKIIQSLKYTTTN